MGLFDDDPYYSKDVPPRAIEPPLEEEADLRTDLAGIFMDIAKKLFMNNGVKRKVNRMDGGGVFKDALRDRGE